MLHHLATSKSVASVGEPVLLRGAAGGVGAAAVTGEPPDTVTSDVAV